MIQEVIPPREKLAGDMKVKRILPLRGGRLLGPFAFLDHMGMEISTMSGGDVGPHPHIGLSTLTYLTEGTILHRDSLGTVQNIQAGDVNWMTAGNGIVHSERISEEVRRGGGFLNGMQAWVALPLAMEEATPSFQHVAKEQIPTFEKDGCQIRLIAGSAFERSSPVIVHSKLFYFQATIPAGRSLDFDPEEQEAGFYLAEGKVTIDDQTLNGPVLILFKTGRSLRVAAAEDAQGFFLGGEPMTEPRYIYWNFVSSSKERLDIAKRQWREQNFPKVPGETEFIPLP